MLTRHFGFHPYRSSIKRSFCKHLQDMPVKVADRYDTGCADANKPVLLIIKLNYTLTIAKWSSFEQFIKFNQ